MAHQKRARRVPIVYQSDVTECGAASLAMMLGYFGRRTSLAECYEALALGRDGVRAGTLLHVARGFGLEGRGVRAELQGLPTCRLPAIVHLGFNHFAVLEAWTPERVRLADPGLGRHWLEMEEFARRFTGVVLELRPGRGFQRPRTPAWHRWVTVGALVRASGSAFLLTQVVLITLIVQLLTLAFPLELKVLIDNVFPAPHRDLLPLVAFALLLLAAARAAADLLRSMLLIALRERWDVHLMPALVEHILSLPYRFFQRRGRDFLVYQIQQSNALRSELSVQTLTVLFDAFVVVLYEAILLLISPLLGTVTAVLLGAQTLWLLAARSRLRILSDREREAQREEDYTLFGMMRDIESIKVLGAEPFVLAHWRSLLHKRVNVTLEQSATRALHGVVDSQLGILGSIFLLVAGGWEVVRGQMTPGAMLAATLIAFLTFRPLTEAVSTIRDLQHRLASAYRLQDTIATEPEQRANLPLAPGLSGSIEVEGLSFRYQESGPLVIQQVSFRVERGQYVAVVGPTGSGKTTLLKLLLGLYPPTAGQIRYDGRPLDGLDLASVRRQVGVVLQNAGILNATLRANIALGHPHTPMQHIRDAARLALIDDDIERMPQGYKTFAGENGSSLSGGQRQRLLLARAFLQRPPIILLDEATSALDPMIERRIAAHLEALGSTRIVVTHRLDAVRHADQILVMDRGRIVERGRHEELVRAGGLYRQLVEGDGALRPLAAGLDV